jgi:hypothetical protein
MIAAAPMLMEAGGKLLAGYCRFSIHIELLQSNPTMRQQKWVGLNES